MGWPSDDSSSFCLRSAAPASAAPLPTTPSNSTFDHQSLTKLSTATHVRVRIHVISLASVPTRARPIGSLLGNLQGYSVLARLL
jgi:hypothetical protein